MFVGLEAQTVGEDRLLLLFAVLVVLRELGDANRGDEVGGLFDLDSDYTVVERGLVEVLGDLKDRVEAGFEEVVRVLSTLEVLVSDNVCRVHAIAQELERHCWLEWERSLSQVLTWRDHRRLSAKSHKAGISTLENTGVVVLLEIDPLDLGHVALLVDNLLRPAVHLVTNLVERLVHVVLDKSTHIVSTGS